MANDTQCSRCGSQCEYLQSADSEMVCESCFNEWRREED